MAPGTGRCSMSQGVREKEGRKVGERRREGWQQEEKQEEKMA